MHSTPSRVTISTRVLHKQRRNEGGKGVTIPRAPNRYGSAEKSQQCRKYFLQQHICFPKGLKFKHGGAKLVSCPGRHLTPLHPCLHCSYLLILDFLLSYTYAQHSRATVVRLDFIVDWHVSIQISVDVSLSLKLLVYWREFSLKICMKMFENKKCKEKFSSMDRLGQ